MASGKITPDPQEGKLVGYHLKAMYPIGWTDTSRDLLANSGM
jgi:hypothetical protein